MNHEEYTRLAKLCAEREEAWRAQVRSSHPAMFSPIRSQTQALVVAAGLIVVLGVEVSKWVWRIM